MGPRFCKRGNQHIERVSGVPIQVLQWGHAFVSVETCRGREARLGRSAASMGPRFCKRGNSTDTAAVNAPNKLQWGHAFVSVET